jgi:hypothetical protein
MRPSLPLGDDNKPFIFIKVNFLKQRVQLIWNGYQKSDLKNERIVLKIVFIIVNRCKCKR